MLGLQGLFIVKIIWSVKLYADSKGCRDLQIRSYHGRILQDVIPPESWKYPTCYSRKL